MVAAVYEYMPSFKWETKSSGAIHANLLSFYHYSKSEEKEKNVLYCLVTGTLYRCRVR